MRIFLTKYQNEFIGEILLVPDGWIVWPPGEVAAERRAWLKGSPRKQAEVEVEGAVADKDSL